jgi:hypothetical protein
VRDSLLKEDVTESNPSNETGMLQLQIEFGKPNPDLHTERNIGTVDSKTMFPSAKNMVL